MHKPVTRQDLRDAMDVFVEDIEAGLGDLSLYDQNDSIVALLERLPDADTEPTDASAESVAALNAIPTDDPEVAHSMADAILLALCAPAVREAYNALVGRCVWWVSA